MVRDEPQNAANDVDLVEQGLQALTDGDVETALQIALKARDISPDDAQHLYLLGLISLRLDRLVDALECMGEGHRRAPDVREFSAALAFLFAAVGNLADSVYHSKLVQTQQPHPLLARYLPAEFFDPETALNMTSLQGFFEDASIAYMSQDYERAQSFCSSELALHPDSLKAIDLFGRISLARGRYFEAAAAFKSAQALRDGVTPEIQALLAESLAGAGDFDAAVVQGLAAVDGAPGDWDVLGRIIAALDSLPDDQYAARAGLVSRWRDALAALPAESITTGRNSEFFDRKLKLGFLINDYVLVHYLDHVEAVMDALIAIGVEVHAYQLFVNNPHAVGRLRGKVSSWRELVEVDDDTAAAVIAGERIDVLVDLCGMSPGARPKILAQHPAALQVNWLAGEVAEGGIDAILADPISRNALPAGTPVLELPFGVFCQPRTALTVSTAEALTAPAEANGYVTFGASLDLARIEPSVSVWARILDAVPESRLLLGNRSGLEQEALDRLDVLFSKHGLSDRILIDLPDASGQLDPFWGKIDVLLTSVSSPNVFEMAEALAMGVPVVARHGVRLAHARAVAVLAQAGQGHLVGEDDDRYLQIAASMALSVETVVELRRMLLGVIGGTQLCDVAGFARSFETALTQALLLLPST